jgi:DNA-binding NarL/FixJ family response regulator
MRTLNKSQIFIVDDHELVRQGLRLLVNGEPDMEVCGEAFNMKQAIDMKSHLVPDVAIIDVSLSDGNGLELTKNLHLWRPEMKILVLSMYEDKLFAERAINSGARGYINKQNSAENILEAIRVVINGNVYLDPEVKERMFHGLNDDSRKASFSLDRLTDREMQVFESIGRGANTHKIANELKVSVKTIETHRSHIKQKLHLKTSTELMRSAIVWSLETH